MINHYFVDRFFVFALFREPNSTNAVRRGSRNIVQARKYHTTILASKNFKINDFLEILKNSNINIDLTEKCTDFGGYGNSNFLEQCVSYYQKLF